MFVKISIAIFLLRLAVRQRYTWTLRISIVILVIWSLVIFFIEIFQCTPVQAQWDFSIPNSRCAPPELFVDGAFSFSVLTVTTDWFYAIIPIPMIWSIQMSVQKKMAIAFILSLGVLYVPGETSTTLVFTLTPSSASIATLIRLKYLIGLVDQSDILCSSPTLFPLPPHRPKLC